MRFVVLPFFAMLKQARERLARHFLQEIANGLGISPMGVGILRSVSCGIVRNGAPRFERKRLRRWAVSQRSSSHTGVLMRIMKAIAAVIVAGMAVCGSARVQAGPLTDAFLINNGATMGERRPLEIAAGDNGDHAILLRNNANESRFTARYRSDGSLIGNALGSTGSYGDSIAVDRVGNTAVVGLIPGTPGVYARVYNRSGALITPQFRVDSGAAGTLAYPVVAMNGDGLIAVTWSNYVGSNLTKYVHYRMFNRNGTARTGVLTVASLYNNQIIEANGIAIDRLGNASVAFVQRDFSSPIGINVWLRRFNSTGTSIGSTVRVNDAAAQGLFPHIAASPEGQFAISWSQYTSGATSRVIMAQRYAASGARIGSNIVVSNASGNAQYNDIGMMDDGSFTVLWDNDNRQSVPSSIPGVFARQYRNDGTAIAPEFRVNSGSVAAFNGQLAMDLSGKYTVMWSQYDSAAAKWSVYGRRYVMDTLPPVTLLQNNVAVSGLSGATGSSQFFKFAIPAGTPSFTVTMTGDGDADMLIRYAALPSLTSYDIFPAINGSNESVQVTNPPEGEFYIEVYGYQPYSNVSLRASY
jgi:serine protease